MNPRIIKLSNAALANACISEGLGKSYGDASGH